MYRRRCELLLFGPAHPAVLRGRRPARRTRSPTARPMRRHPAARLAELLIRVGWRWRVELAAVLVMVAVWSGLAVLTSRPIATMLAVMLLSLVLTPAPMRGRLGRIERQARVRRGWARACRHAGLETFNERLPRITRISTVPVGEVLRVRLCPPANPRPTWRPGSRLWPPISSSVKSRSPAILTTLATPRSLWCAGMRWPAPCGWPGPTCTRPGCACGSRSPWASMSTPARWRSVWLSAICCSAVSPAREKSVAQSLLIATAALDPDTDLWLLDGKRVELAAWRHCARALVGPDIDETIDVLRQLQPKWSSGTSCCWTKDAAKSSRATASSCTWSAVTSWRSPPLEVSAKPAKPSTSYRPI